MQINLSGLEGHGSAYEIYETSGYEYPWRGARVTHGWFCEGKGDERINVEIVELQAPGLNIRVRAEDVRVDLRPLLVAYHAWQRACYSKDLQPARDQAFPPLQAAIFKLAAEHFSASIFEKIAEQALKDGAAREKHRMQCEARKLFGL